LASSGAQMALHHRALLQVVIVRRQRQDARAQRDRQPGQAVREAVAVEAFQLAAQDGGAAAQIFQRHQQFPGAHRVLAEQGQRLAAQHGQRRLQQLVGKADLADVVQQPGDENLLALARVQFHAGGDLARQVGHQARVAGLVVRAQLDHAGEDLDGGDEVVLSLLLAAIVASCSAFSWRVRASTLASRLWFSVFSSSFWLRSALRAAVFPVPARAAPARGAPPAACRRLPTAW
jgi:hypothetical protein